MNYNPNPAKIQNTKIQIEVPSSTTTNNNMVLSSTWIGLKSVSERKTQISARLI